MEFGQTPPIMPSSCAMNWRSTPKGFPASAPLPKGEVATRGIRSLSRMSSRWNAAAWHISQWLQRTVMAGCRWVKPGMSTSHSRSARSDVTMISSCSAWRIWHSSLYSQSRVSVATWSFLERPVCSLPPTAPTISVSLRSLAVWMSSSPALITNVPASHSLPTFFRPSTMVSASSLVKMPALESALAYTWLPFKSSAHMRLSKGSDSLNFSIRGSVLPVKRPPHSFFSPAGWDAEGAAPSPWLLATCTLGLVMDGGGLCKICGIWVDGLRLHARPACTEPCW
mmetsp:Transcript_22664/g.62571  ORF Transcript_22664/g.62571 Transcript_22664/m.62571 type:complete len:282 (-) Transcript_22664:148-993(-)